MKIKKITRHGLDKILHFPEGPLRERQLKSLRSMLFEKGLDVVQLHRSTGLCVVTDEEWADCVAWHQRLCDKDWTAFKDTPAVVKKHLPKNLKRLANLED